MATAIQHKQTGVGTAGKGVSRGGCATRPPLWRVYR
jgi:hypothetical protein